MQVAQAKRLSLSELEQLQDDVNRQLAELNLRIERALREQSEAPPVEARSATRAAA